MSAEARLQSQICSYLRNKGAYVIKTRPGPGVPTGCPDIIFLYEGFYGALEVKAGPKARYQPLQAETLEKLHEWSWAKRVDLTTWPEIRAELEVML